MRTLALTAVLATALAGTGCIVTADEPTGDLDLAWRFQNSDGALAGNWTAGNSGCGVALPDDVSVALYDDFNHLVFSRTFPCQEAGSGLPRAYVSNLRSGSYAWVATAYRAGSPIFEDGGSVFVNTNATAQVDATLGVLTPAPLTIYFTQGGVFTCAGTPRIRYDLFTAGGVFLESNDQIACDPVSFGFTADTDRPTGFSYEVDLYALTAGGASVNETCRTLVRHSGFPTTIDLLAAPDPACGP